MPRNARKRTDTGTYHIIQRGNDRQQIFHVPEDYRMYLDCLAECKALSGFKVFAYCLMGNHIHLLLRFEREDISLAMKRLGLRFVQRMNIRYGRTGHLFQDRYKSEAVEDDRYFLNLVRYIHQNPVKAKLAKDAAGYEYSSYHAYTVQEAGSLVDTDFLYGIIRRDQFEDLHKTPAEGQFLDIPETGTALTDRKAGELIMKAAGVGDPAELRQMNSIQADSVIALLLGKGASIRQLSRLTGIPKGHVESVSRRGKR